MSRLIVCLFVLLVSLGVTPVAAQDFSVDWGCHIAQKGDSFWRIADRELTADQWKVLWAKNPTTPNGKPRRFFKNPLNGFSYVQLDVGEEICGLKEIGNPVVATPAELAQMGLLKTVTETKEVVPNWFWWTLALIVMLALIGSWWNWMMNRPGATSGPAFVPGGVAATGVSQEETFRTHAVRAADRAGLMIERSNVRVSDVRPGRIWGVLSTLYNNGADQIHRYHGDRAYEAMVTYNNGNSVRMYMLDACGNPLIYGGVARYIPGPDFRFEADSVPAPDPTPVPPPAAMQVVPTSEPDPTPTINQSGEFIRHADAPPQNGHADLLKISFRPEEGGKDSLVQAEGVDVERFTFEKNGNSITFRFREAKTNK